MKTKTKTWPDGTPQSSGAFTRHINGEPSIFAADKAFCPSRITGESASSTATKAREKVEATGKNIGTIVGLSKKVDKTQADARRYHVTITKGGH